MGLSDREYAREPESGFQLRAPQSGVGLLLAISLIVTIIQTFRRDARWNKAFATREELERERRARAADRVERRGVGNRRHSRLLASLAPPSPAPRRSGTQAPAKTPAAYSASWLRSA